MKWLKTEIGLLNADSIVIICNPKPKAEQTVVIASDGNRYRVQAEELARWIETGSAKKSL